MTIANSGLTPSKKSNVEGITIAKSLAIKTPLSVVCRPRIPQYNNSAQRPPRTPTKEKPIEFTKTSFTFIPRTFLLITITAFLCFSTNSARADLWGGDLPLLAEIVFNTLHTMIELEKQSQYMNDELDGIKDRIDRIRTISDVVQPSTWNQWKDPKEALRRLQLIYYTMPKEYKSQKSAVIEDEISKAMNMVGKRIGKSKGLWGRMRTV